MSTIDGGHYQLTPSPVRAGRPDAYYLSDLATEQLENSGKSSLAFRKKVEKELIKRLPGLVPSADQVAGALGMSRRTLARKLEQEQTTFREIVDTLMYDLSKSYLSDGLSVGEISYYLGYADHAAFSTAFKRWSGKSPKGYQSSEKETLN